MAMFSFDEQAALFDVTPLPNQFILNYLPEASGDAVRVYLFGLVACYHHEAISNLQQMARELNMTEDDIRAAYRYWERKGLVQRVADNPPQYRYQNIYQVMMTGAQAQIDPAYEQFAEAIYGVFDNDRRLHGKDVSQCYEWVEQMRLPPDVVIAMMRHMVQKHGKNVSMKKAEQMAMRLADEKVQTVEEAQEIFRRDQTVWSGSKKVLEKLGLRRYPTEPEQTMYSKWLVDWQFTPDAILRAVDETIKSSNPSFAYLDGILKRLHEQGNVRTEQDVSGDIEGSRKENEPIKQFLRALGNYSITINDTTKATYKSFQTMYPDPVILLAAQQCAKWGMTTLQDVMQTLMAWQNRSLRTLPEIDAYMRQIDEQNEFLIVLYQAMQLDEKTKPNAADRALVKQWTEEWRFAQMFVLGCAPWAAGKKSPMAYLNKMLKVSGKRHHDDGGGKGGARTLRAAAEPIHRTRRARAEGRRGAAVHSAHLHADAGCHGRHDAGVGGKPCVRKSCRRCSRSTSSSASKIRRRSFGGGRRLSPAARRLGSTSPSART